MDPWRNRILRTSEVPPEDLLANPLNWRIHPGHQQAALGGVLDEVGWVNEVLVNANSGFVIDGHLRVALALRRGEPTIPVKYVDLTDAEERLVLATFDPIGALAVRDIEKSDVLERLLQEDGLGDILKAVNVAGLDHAPVRKVSHDATIICPHCGKEFILERD